MLTDVPNLLGPISFRLFVEKYLERTYLKIAESLTVAEVRRVLLRAQLDQLLNRLPLDPARYRVIRGGTVDHQPDMLPSGGVDPQYLTSAYGSGSSLIFQNVETALPSVGSLCEAMAERFLCRVFANIYATPGAVSGFAPHYDDHDVFVLQCYGSKQWSFYSTYDNQMELPLYGFRFDPAQHTPGKIASSLILNPGDVLYVPRGLMHAAAAKNEDSIHITFGVEWITVNEVLLDVISSSALSNSDYRASLVRLGARALGADEPPADLGCVEDIKKIVSVALSGEQIANSVTSLLSHWKTLHMQPPHVARFATSEELR